MMHSLGHRVLDLDESNCFSALVLAVVMMVFLVVVIVWVFEDQDVKKL